MKNLYLVRHAKSSWKDSSLSDIDRPLNKRGLKNAPEMGKRLLAGSTKIDLIISSPARRAYLTASLLASEIGYGRNHIEINESLYFSGNSEMLKLIQNTQESVKSLMIVGHNPDMTSMLNSFCGEEVTYNMPTCSIACLHFNTEWKDVCYASGSMAGYDFPKKYL